VIGPKDLLSVFIRLTGIVLSIRAFAEFIVLAGGLGCAGLNYIKFITLLIMFLLGLYLLRENNYLFLLGVKGMNTSFEKNFTIETVTLLGSKTIGLIIIVIQLIALLDLAQFVINSNAVDINTFIWSFINCALLISIGYYLLRFGHTLGAKESKKGYSD